MSLAIKKVVKPFATSILGKRTYRELKLLKHLRHDNVRKLPPQLLQSVLKITP
jgi:p38 MAP kinase